LDKISPLELKEHLKRLSGWTVLNNQLCVKYNLGSFMQVMSFANLVSDKSEQINHHPKFIIEYNKISFDLSTHEVGGITKLDIQLATFIDETYNELFSI